MGLNSFQTSGNSPGQGRECYAVGILGLGTVGAAIARRLTGPDSIPSLYLTHICDRHVREKRARQLDSVQQVTWTDRFDDLLTSDVDVSTRAGSDAIAVSVLGDLAVLSRDRAAIVPGPALVEPREIRGLSDTSLAEAV